MTVSRSLSRHSGQKYRMNLRSRDVRGATAYDKRITPAAGTGSSGAEHGLSDA